jgi:hypothetical protein
MDSGCTRFHYCVDGFIVGQPMECPGGFMFDEVLGICNWPETVLCEAELCQTPAPVELTGECCSKNGLRPYDGCNSFFTCANGQIAGGGVMSCPDGTLFDEAIQTCNFPSAFECGPEVCFIPTAAPIAVPIAAPTAAPTMTPPTPVTPVGGTTVASVDGPVDSPAGAPVGTSGVRMYELSLVVLLAVSVLLGLAF